MADTNDKARSALIALVLDLKFIVGALAGCIAGFVVGAIL